MRRMVLLALALLAVAWGCRVGLLHRRAVIAEYRNFAGDGWQYYHLAENLVRDHRFAFAPPPVPPAWSRLPGYPLFIAATARALPRFDPDGVGLVVAERQCWLDLLTAILALLLAAEAGLAAPRWLAFALCLASPLLATLCSYLLSETLSVTLSTAILWLLARASREGGSDRARRIALGAAGALLAAAMLVRADAVTLVPCFALPIALAPPGRRLSASATAIACALLLFLPWPLRNAIRFHALHPTGAEWVTKQGDPLPTGPQRWLRTWAVDPHDAAMVAWPMTRGTIVYPLTLGAGAWDDPTERAVVVKAFDLYNRAGGVTDGADAAFTQLADARRRSSFVRYWLKLPWARAKQLWLEPVPDWELPIASRTLRLPETRSDWRRATTRPLALAGLGLVVLLFYRRGRRLGALALIAAVARTAAIVFVVPGGTQRYLVELLPLELVLASVALLGPAELVLRRLAGRPPGYDPLLLWAARPSGDTK